MSEETKVKKPFFKSVSFKCIVVLLIIALVSGIFLTFCNALFTVSDTERLERALGKLYTDGETVSNPVELEVDESISVDDAEIENVYEITSISGEYVLKVTGAGGFSGGSVTCYIRVYVGSSSCEVKKISISSNVGQSYIAKVGSDDLEALINQQSDSGFTKFSTDGITCGATYSLTAISNATNAALTYMNAKYLGITTSTPYDSFDYIDYINKDETTHSVDGNIVSYSIVTKSSGLAPNAYKITVAVGSNGTISEYKITAYGSYAYDKDYPSLEYGSGFETYLVGKSQSDIEAIIGSGENLSFSSSTISSYADGSTVFTGATQSNFICLYAALFATANYQNCIGG